MKHINLKLLRESTILKGERPAVLYTAGLSIPIKIKFLL